MKRIAIFTLILAAVFSLSFALAVPQTALAQDETMMESHVCDSTLILLLYIAEYDYGFHSMMDLSSFEKGQLSPLFDAMMMDEEMMDMTEEAMMDEEMMDMTEEAMMDEEMMDTVMLSMGHIEGEDPACTALREEISAFFYVTYTEMMMMEEGE
jgi:hypothetical protein